MSALTVESVIVERVKRWLETQAPRLRDGDAWEASIKFTIKAPGGDEDNTLVLDLDVEERVHQNFDEEDGLRVEGVVFDTSMRPEGV